MKKIIFITLIFFLFFMPIAFSIENGGIRTDFAIVKAIRGNIIRSTNPNPPKPGSSSIGNANTNKGTSANPSTPTGIGKVKDSQKATSNTTAQTNTGGGPNCGSVDLLCQIKSGANYLLEVVASIPIAITSVLVMATGMLLNLAIIETIVKLGTNINNISSINTVWSTLRDLANIFFIFGLLAIAISTILGLQGYGYKKLLAKLIIVALFINFSMFFTKSIIDVSNIFSLQFYQAISTTSTDGSTGIANAFTRSLGVSTVWDNSVLLDTLRSVNYSEGGGIAIMFIYMFFVVIFFSITAFVFAFAAILLIVRSVGLIFLIILSPLAFAAMILPRTQKLADQWWEKLWQYAIFAPILMLLFWITASIIPSITATFGSTGGLIDSFAASTQQGRLGGVSMILNFIIIISFIIASVVISNKLSISFGKQATKLAGKATFGVLGAGGRTTFGRAFSKLSQSEGLKEAAAKGGLTGIGARLALRTTRAGAKASYDLRGAPGVTSGAKNLGIDVGKVRPGGYEAILKKQIEDRKKFGASLSPNTITQAKLRRPFEDKKEDMNAREERIIELKSDADDKVKNIKKRKEILIREGKEYSPETETLEVELTAAEGKLAQAEKLVKKIGQQKKNVEKEIKKIGSIGKERAKSYASELAAPEVEIFGVKVPVFVPRKNKEAVIAIRKGKTDEEKLIEGLSKKMKEKEKSESKGSSKTEKEIGDRK